MLHVQKRALRRRGRQNTWTIIVIDRLTLYTPEESFNASRRFHGSISLAGVGDNVRALLGLPVILGLLGQTPPPGGDTAAESGARLEFMKKSLVIYDIHARDDRGTKLRLQAEPVLRFTNPVGGSQDGAVFLWLGEADRPAVAVQIYWNPRQVWLEEFSSLSTVPLIAKSAEGRDWCPGKGGVSFKPVPDAPKRAQTADRRFRQMRAIAEGFSAEHVYKGVTRNKLRLLTKPLARFGKPAVDEPDGALFCFAHGTDPEVLLLLESQPGKDGPEWQYAFAPMTSFAVSASWKGKEIWSLPPQANGSARDAKNTFHVRRVLLEGDD